MELRPYAPAHAADHQRRARDLLEGLEPDLKAYLADHAARLASNLRHQLETAGSEARAQ